MKRGWYVDLYGGMRHSCGALITVFSPGERDDVVERMFADLMARHEELCAQRDEDE